MSGELNKYAWLTVGVALLTFLLKLWAAYLTGSVGLLSDALESIINLVSSSMLVIALKIAKAPPDQEHPFGHDKAEYFANGVQGTLILLAAFSITWAALERLWEPQMLEAAAEGIGLAVAASLLNLVAARILLNKGKALKSDGLQGEAHHLMSDVWSSVAVVAGVGLVYLTDLTWLDPAAALAVSVWVLVTGLKLIKNSVTGLMDQALPAESQAVLLEILERYQAEKGMDFHALRSRVSGARTFITVHILVPGAWTVKKGHDLLDELEAEVADALSGVTMVTHLEPLEEESSFLDTEIV